MTYRICIAFLAAASLGSPFAFAVVFLRVSVPPKKQNS